MDTRFLFADGEYEFWIVEFLTGRSNFLFRCPSSQVPIIAFEKIVASRWETYRNGTSRETLKLDTLQDPWKIIRRIQWDSKDLVEVERWILACKSSGNTLSYQDQVLIDDSTKIKWPYVQENFNFSV